MYLSGRQGNEVLPEACRLPDDWREQVEEANQGGVSMSEITERRAEFIYEGARIAAIAAKAPIVPVSWVDREQPFKDQFLEVIDRQCGDERSDSPEELHDDWAQAYFGMGWVFGDVYDRENKIHPDLVPYDALGQLERDKDAVFVMLCEIARLYIYNQEGSSKQKPDC